MLSVYTYIFIMNLLSAYLKRVHCYLFTYILVTLHFAIVKNRSASGYTKTHIIFASVEQHSWWCYTMLSLMSNNCVSSILHTKHIFKYVIPIQNMLLEHCCNLVTVCCEFHFDCNSFTCKKWIYIWKELVLLCCSDFLLQQKTGSFEFKVTITGCCGTFTSFVSPVPCIFIFH